jgi:hypothetical protein
MTEDEKIRASIPCVTLRMTPNIKGHTENQIVSIPEGYTILSDKVFLYRGIKTRIPYKEYENRTIYEDIWEHAVECEKKRRASEGIPVYESYREGLFEDIDSLREQIATAKMELEASSRLISELRHEIATLNGRKGSIEE